MKLDTINRAIWATLDASEDLDGVGKYRNIGPEGVELPYIVWTEISITPDDTFSGRYWSMLVQFDCYAQKTATQSAQSVASDIAEALCTAMDGATFTLTDLSHICNRYIFQQARWDDEVKAARVIVEYRIIVGA